MGCCFVPVILGSDKTTVSVATGNNEYYPLYVSIGNVHNSVRRAHRGSVAVIAFLAMPKGEKSQPIYENQLIQVGDRKWDKDSGYLNFKRQLFHNSLSRILQCLLPAMTTPMVMQCPDRHLRRIIFGLGPYIADYPEQIFLAGVLSGWCAR